MRCANCREKIDGNWRRVGLRTIHPECFEEFIDRTVKSVQEKKKVKIKKMTERNDKQKAKDTAWKWFSKFIRLRDADRNGMVACIDCGKMHPWNKGTDAGHFIPKSAGEIFYFDENNTHGQARQCNYYGSQDTGARYRRALVKKIGEDAVKYLEQLKASHSSLQRTTEDYRELSKLYREKCKDIVSLRGFDSN